MSSTFSHLPIQLAKQILPMGRRALPKIDDRLNLTRHFLEFEQLPDPWEKLELFGREAPLEIEVGSGKGLFIQNATGANPDHDFLGIEVSRKYARFAAARLTKQNAGNGRIVHGDGLRLFRELLPDDHLEAVHVYFPDPWWKARHHKRRVLNEPFLTDVVRTLRPGGKLHFWTDVQAYYNATLELIAKRMPLSGPIEVTERSPQHDLDYRTHFERRTRLNKEPVYRAEFVKAG